MNEAPDMLAHALEYLEIGMSIVPLHHVTESGRCSCGARSCGKPGKHPKIRWKDLTSSPLTREQIEEHWTRSPESNIGVITGEVSNLAVLDIDGEDGVAALEEHGLPLTDLPPTPTSRTGGGGLHYYFRMSDRANTGTGILKNVDIRAQGGLVVVPPSMHASGRRYEWHQGRSPIEVEFADFDFGLLTKEQSDPIDQRRDRWYERLLAGVSEPGRNDAATRLAGRYFGLGLSDSEVFFLLRGWNRYNDPPMDMNELRATVESIHGADREDREESRENILETISEVLRVKLDNVKRITGDDPKIILEFDQGTAMLTTTQLLSPKSFQQSIAEATKVVIKRLGARSTPTHDRLAQMVLQAAEDVDAGDEATGTGELVLMVSDYLHMQGFLPRAEGDEVPLRGPFVREGRVWVSATDLVQRAGVKWGTRPSLAGTAQMMRAIGMIRKSFPTPSGGAKTMWGIEVDRVPFVSIADEEAA